ncbi:MAG: imidazole glycerol phosphate synthase subunit HisH [Bdellovibrionales bacterium]|nr:imidazole glycerol phosphate synthase subunit HisH [Bdellovibrionales bacterium]
MSARQNLFWDALDSLFRLLTELSVGKRLKSTHLSFWMSDCKRYLRPNMIVVVDYGMSNVRSIVNKIERLKLRASVGRTPEDVLAADKLIIPGVGHFAAGMKNLRSSGLLDALELKVRREGAPVLGICLGMQLLGTHSEEGDVEGLGWIDARVRRFQLEGVQHSGSSRLRVPHVGWNTIEARRPSILLDGQSDEPRFYFVHSYHMDAAPESEAVVATTLYGYPFASIVQQGNIYGTQFHPEKSHHYGMRLLEQFLRCA